LNPTTQQPPDEYQQRVAAEQHHFADMEDIHDLPPIAHYWGDKFIRPMAAEFGFNLAEELFAKYLAVAMARTGRPATFLSLGAGNCDTEVRTAQLLREAGCGDFVIECLELNPPMLERGRELARQVGVEDCLNFVEGDFNRWSASKTYSAIIANQALHHVLELERLFAEVKRALHPEGFFVADDMIGRNGHLRWPEALDELRRFWRELPLEYRWNRQLKRYEEEFVDHDCSSEGFEGIRAQDILPLLLNHFDFHVFLAFGNLIDPFVDRSFGFHFDAEADWDRAFIDKVQAHDEKAILSGALTPTHMLAVMTPGPCAEHRYSRGLNPRQCVRRERAPLPPGRLEVVTPGLRPMEPHGSAYSMKMAASGGAAPYTWSAVDLPPGLTLDSGGLLSGAIEADGDFSTLITVRDSSAAPRAAAQRYTILAKPRKEPGQLTLAPGEELRAGVTGVKYAEALVSLGGSPPLAWSLTEGTLPPGLSLDAESGVISGEPLSTCRSSFGVQVSDSSGERAEGHYELEIEPPPAAALQAGVFPHLACGGAWRTAILLVNPSPAQISLSIDMRSSSGKRLDWPLDPAPAGGYAREARQYALAPHGTLRIAVAPDWPEESTGWARILATGPVMGYATFHYAPTLGARSEINVPMEWTNRRERSIPFDNRDGRQTGVALLNLSSDRHDCVAATLWDEDGTLLSTSALPLGGGRHTAFMLDDKLPFTRLRRGVMTIRAVSGAPIHVVALCKDSSGVFAHLPQIPSILA